MVITNQHRHCFILLVFPGRIIQRYGRLPIIYSNCIDHNITRVALLGDSQGPFWKSAVMSFLQGNNTNETGFTKEMIKQESGGGRRAKVDRSYFEDDHNESEHLLTHERECSMCQSRLWSVSNGDHAVNVEYLSQEFVMDTEIQRFFTHWSKECHDMTECQNLTAYSTQEYYWKMYLPKQWPQIVVRFATLMHDAGRFTETEFVREFKHQIQIILDYAPRTTKVYWMVGQPFADQQWEDRIRRWNDIAVRLITEHGEGRVVIVPYDLFAIKRMYIDRYVGRWTVDNAHQRHAYFGHLITKIWPWVQDHYLSEM